MNKPWYLFFVLLLSGCFDQWLPTCIGKNLRVDLICTQQDGSQKSITCDIIDMDKGTPIWSCQTSGQEKSCTGQKAHGGEDWYESQSYVNLNNPAWQFQFAQPPSKVQWVNRNTPVSAESDCDDGEATYYPTMEW